MSTRISLFASSAVVALAMSACGGVRAPQTEYPRGPESLRAEPKASTSEGWGSASSPSADPAHDTGTNVDEQAAQQPAAHHLERARSAADVLTAPEVVFMIDYANTDAYREAATGCAATFGDALEERSQCLRAARAQFSADAIRFTTDEKGQLWWVTYKRHGSELSEAHASPVEFVTVEPHRVIMTVKGPEQGQRPIMRDRSRIAIAVPDEYSIELRDSHFGRLVYDAKVGLVGR